MSEHRARALNTAAYLNWVLGDMDAARQEVEEALSTLRLAQDEASRAASLQILGLVLTSEGAYALADKAMKDGLTISEQLSDYRSSVFSLAFQGDIALQMGDRSEAERVYIESARLLRASGNKNFLAYPVRRLGYLALAANELRQAAAYFLESLTLNQEVGDKRGLAASLITIAMLALRLHQPVVAARLYGAVEGRLEALSVLLYSDQAELGRVRSHLHTVLDEPALNTAVSEGWAMGDDQAIALARELGGTPGMS